MPTAVELYNEADQLKAAGKLEEAVAKFEEALAADPNYVVAHSALAVTLQRMGKQDEAIAHARQACELGPDDPFNFTSMSVIYQRAYAATGDMQYIPLAEEAMEKSRIMQSQQQ